MTLHPVLLATFSLISGAADLRAEEPEGPREAQPAVPAPPGTPGPGIPWSGSLPAARAAASAAGKPMLADFTADWCHFCKQLDRETLSEARVVQFVRESFVAVRIDADQESGVVKEFRVTGLPTVLFLSPAGKEVLRIEGFRPAAEFLAAARRAADLCASVARLRELAEKDPRDAAAQRTYARALFAAGETAAAAGVLEAAIAAHQEAGARAGIYLDLGDGLRGAGKLAEARSAYEKATALPVAAAPEEWAGAALALARILVAAGELDGALKVLGAALAESAVAGDARWEALFLRGYVHAVRKDAEQAIADLKKARTEDPKGRWGVRAGLIVDLIEVE